MGMATAGADPGAEYVIVLYDRETSSIAAFVDGNRVSAYRTAATSAAALDRLAPSGPLRLAVLGSGLEAAMHVRALAAVRPLERLTVFSPTSERREAFATAAAADLGVEVEPGDSPEAAVAGASVVLAADCRTWSWPRWCSATRSLRDASHHCPSSSRRNARSPHGRQHT